MTSLLLLSLLSTLLLSTFAEYSLNFKDPTSSLTYTYDSPIDFTNAEIRFRLKIDLDFYSDVNNLVQGAEFPLPILRVESERGADGASVDFLSVDLLDIATADTPPQIMIMLITPVSYGDTPDASFCLMTDYYDWNGKVISIIKTGPSFTMSIEGFEEEYNYWCQMSPTMGVEGTGKMQMSKVIIGENFMGCTSLLSFPGQDLLNPDECGFSLEYITGDVTYFEGATCDAIPDTSVVCPTTKPPTTKPPTKAPTTKAATTKAATTKKATTKKATTKAATTKKATTEKATTKPATKEKTEPKPTTAAEELPGPETEKTTTEQPTEEKVATTKKESTDKPKTDAPKTDAPIVDDNETDNEYEIDNNPDPDNVIADKDASIGAKGASSSIIIIICVVAAGILVVVILLYVGYRFHFRDKGSYKLEETKGEPNGEDFGNEYTDLNPTSKDQEWYL